MASTVMAEDDQSLAQVELEESKDLPAYDRDIPEAVVSSNENKHRKECPRMIALVTLYRGGFVFVDTQPRGSNFNMIQSLRAT